MPTTFHALALAWRRLAAQPAFALTATVSLALGIGASTAIYSIAYGVLLRPLPFPEPDRLVELRQVDADGRSMRFSRANAEDVATAARSFDGLARSATIAVPVVEGGTAVRVTAGWVSPDFFHVMQVAPILGRTFSPDESREGGPAVVVISYGLWQEQLRGRDDVLGQPLRIGDETHTVVGVMPQGFAFPRGARLWTSANRVPSGEKRTAHNWHVVARLAPDTSVVAAQQELTAVARTLKATYADETWMTDGLVVPLRDALVGNATGLIGLLAGAVGFLLLVSCATVANLLLVQGALRTQEFAIRQAVGATWSRLLRQLVTEHVLLVALGGAAGVWLAQGAVNGLLALDPGLIPLGDAIGIDGSVLSFALGLTTTLVVLLALTSAVRLLHDQPLRSLAGAGRGGIGTRNVDRLRRALVVTQIAFTLVLLVGATLLGQRLWSLVRVDPGFRTDVLVASVTLPRLPDIGSVQPTRAADIRAIVERLAADGRVRAAGGITALPLTGMGGNGTFLEVLPGDTVTTFEEFGALGRLPGRSGSAEYRAATPGYFEALGIPLRKGRFFDARDTPDTPHVALVSETLAQVRWPDVDPIGRQLQFGNMDGDLRTLTVVGVVADVRDGRLDEPPPPMIYANAQQRASAWPAFTFVLRGETAPLTLSGDARAAIGGVVAEAPVSFRELGEVVEATYGRERFSLLIVLGFASSALVLAVLGVYGLSSYAVATRTREIGLRMVLGAAPSRIVSQVLREGLALVAIGAGLGVVGAVAVSRLLAALVEGVAAWSSPALLIGLVVVGASALLACLVPARRASRIEPATALRER